jgi:ribose transport system permease protein
MTAITMLPRSGRSGMQAVTIALPVLSFVLLCFLSPSFRSLQNLGNINGQVTTLLIVSLGQLIVALTGGVDLSVGGTLSLVSAIIVTIPQPIAVPVALLAGVAVGLVNGIGVTLVGIHPIIMTLASATFLQGLALLIHPVPGGTVPDVLVALATTSFVGFPVAFLWCLILVLAVWFTLSKTRFGLRVFAIGANAESAARNGVSVAPCKLACYVLCAALSAVAGIFLTARVSSGDATIGAPFALDSITAIALGGVQLAGGVGSVAGVVLGTLTLGLMTNGMNLLGISPFIRTAATGLLLLAAISMQRRTVIGV